MFDITLDDLNRIANRMRKEKVCFDLTTLVKRVVQGRFRYGPDYSPVVLTSLPGRESVRLWDPADDWVPGDGVIVALWVKFNELGRNVYEARVGEVIAIDEKYARMRLDGISDPKEFQRAQPGSENALKWHVKVQEVVAQKQASPEINEQVDAVLLDNPLLTDRLRQALGCDERFICLEGRWCLKEILPILSQDQLQTLYRQLLIQGKAVRPHEMVQWLHPALQPDEIGPFAIHMALLLIPDKFVSLGTASTPLWQAIKPPPPLWQEAEGAFYVYDPQTYEILLQPGMRLKKATADRLQSLGWYDRFVQAVESIR